MKVQHLWYKETVPLLSGGCKVVSMNCMSFYRIHPTMYLGSFRKESVYQYRYLWTGSTVQFMLGMINHLMSSFYHGWPNSISKTIHNLVVFIHSRFHTFKLHYKVLSILVLAATLLRSQMTTSLLSLFLIVFCCFCHVTLSYSLVAYRHVHIVLR